MLNHKIDALKLGLAMVDLCRNNPQPARMSTLDLVIFLSLNATPNQGKNELVVLLNGPDSKSYLDRPIDRLLHYGLIDETFIEGAVTRNGDARRVFFVSTLGKKFLKECS